MKKAKPKKETKEKSFDELYREAEKLFIKSKKDLKKATETMKKFQ